MNFVEPDVQTVPPSDSAEPVAASTQADSSSLTCEFYTGKSMALIMHACLCISTKQFSHSVL